MIVILHFLQTLLSLCPAVAFWRAYQCASPLIWRARHDCWSPASCTRLIAHLLVSFLHHQSCSNSSVGLKLAFACRFCDSLLFQLSLCLCFMILSNGVHETMATNHAVHPQQLPIMVRRPRSIWPGLARIGMHQKQIAGDGEYHPTPR
jgi:hypothetical protein